MVCCTQYVAGGWSGDVWNLMAHGDAREGKWRGNWRMEWIASTLHTTSERGVSSITTTAYVHTSTASSRLDWRPRRFKWTRPFRRKTKSGFCACTITFQTQSTTYHKLYSSSSSIGTATLVGFGLHNYRWVFSAGRSLQNAIASGTSNPQLGGPVIRTFQLPPPGVPHVWNDASEPQQLKVELWTRKFPRILPKVATFTSLSVSFTCCKFTT